MVTTTVTRDTFLSLMTCVYHGFNLELILLHLAVIKGIEHPCELRRLPWMRSYPVTRPGCALCSEATVETQQVGTGFNCWVMRT